MTDEQLKQYRDASNRLMDPDCGEMEAMNLAMWLGERAHIMLDQIEELKKIHPDWKPLINIANCWLGGRKIEKDELTEALRKFLFSFRSIPEEKP